MIWAGIFTDIEKNIASVLYRKNYFLRINELYLRHYKTNYWDVKIVFSHFSVRLLKSQTVMLKNLAKFYIIGKEIYIKTLTNLFLAAII